MKNFISIFFILSSVAFTSAANYIPPQEVTVSFQVFYDQLSPYGAWYEYDGYGYIWVPTATAGFTPYSSSGHWVWTDYGWTWVSDYSWGWAPFHYGRWDYDEVYGWFWVPGDEWGPAWVSWRRSPGYYGWAPLRPGISIGIAFQDNIPAERWIFVNEKNVTRYDIHNYYVGRRENTTIIKNSKIISSTRVDKSRNVTYIPGPEREEVEKTTGSTIKPVSIKENSKPGQNISNNQLSIYRPRVQKNAEGERKPAPTKLSGETSGEKKVSENKAMNKTQPDTKQPVQPIPKTSTNEKTSQPKTPVNNTKVKEQPKNISPTNNEKKEQPGNTKPAVQPSSPKHTNSPGNQKEKQNTPPPVKPAPTAKPNPAPQPQAPKVNPSNNRGQPQMQQPKKQPTKKTTLIQG